MFVKQIDMKAALELAAKGREVMILVPGRKESGWNDMTPDTLQHMLEGCLFFRKEPAMEKELAGIAPPPRKKTVKGVGGKKPIDTGKLLALHKAGWSNVKIADELGISDVTVGKYLKRAEEKEDGKQPEKV